MAWLDYAPVAVWCTFALILGLLVGSFLNVLVARLPFEKSIVWPGSRCFSCYRPIRMTDNLPILGYLRLGGKCRHCGTPFSARYMWVEVGTGVAFLGLFVLEVLVNPTNMPGVRFDVRGSAAYPPAAGLALFAYHACLLSLLIAAAVIDAEHRIIPPLIPYTGLVIGVIGAAFMPWPWPHPAAAADFTTSPPGPSWILSEYWGKIPIGAQPWPFWGPLLGFAPAASWKLGLMNSVAGALAGSLVVRAVKWLFETGFGKEALGLGDADLLMMAGAFLGWQVAVFSLFVGAFAALLVFKLPGMIVAAIRKTAVERELPFGPGLAVGVVVTWLSWPWLGPRVQFPIFDPVALGVVVGVLSVGMLAAGLLLRAATHSPRKPGVEVLFPTPCGEGTRERTRVRGIPRTGPCDNMPADVVIVDYGMGNLRSVQKAFERVGFAADVTSDPHRITTAAKVVLPGVGAFCDAIARLRETRLADAITDHARSGRPFLGICLGMQLLFTRSHEDGLFTGLDLIPGEVVRFPEEPGLKVPHMGWNTLKPARPDCPLFAGLPPDPVVYFVHSYFAMPTNRAAVAAEADYPGAFCAAVWQANVFATQFHPEKSQEVGLTMLKNFAQL